MKSIYNSSESHSSRSHIASKTRMFNLRMQIAICLLVICTFNIFADSEKHWVGTWAASAYKATSNTPSNSLSNNTLRQIVRVSIGGDTLRIKFSNITCAKAISIKSVTIARSPDGTKCPVDAATIKQLKFKGDSTVTIGAKSEVYSDPIAFNLTPSMRLAITIYYGDCQSSSDMTFHYGCRGNSYWAEGNKTASADFTNTTIPMWFTICSVDVLAPSTAGAVVCFGNSITDGYGLSEGKQNRWTDMFSEKLLANPATAQVGVLNEGIGATNVLTASNGAEAGITRFQPDVLNQSGVRWIIIFYGVNDIGASASANSIIAGYQTLIKAAHEKNIIVYGATITPFGTYSNTSYTSHEDVRNSVNVWIRTKGNFDGVIDFEKVIQDPSASKNLLSKYSKDGLHPNADGYKLLGESIDLSLFKISDVPSNSARHAKMFGCSENLTFSTINGKTMLSFEIPNNAFVSLKAYSLLGKEIAELAGRNFSAGEHSVELKNDNLTNGKYIYTIKADGFTASSKMVFPAK